MSKDLKPFCFKNFSIKQSSSVFRVGTDAVLLGALTTVENIETALEVGCGTGIISLMVAQRNPSCSIIAIDIDENTSNLAQENFDNSIYHKQLKAININFKEYQPKQKFDLIFSNPPYFEANSSDKDKIARQRLTLDFECLIERSTQLLSKNGIFSVIIPAEYEKSFTQICKIHSLFPQKKINIKGIEHNPKKRVILEFSFSKKEIKDEDFIIEKSPRQYSDQYLEATKDFHIFNS
ncbi:tRNA1(Val) (adenine(37)-N6)-methyltransferase [Riemerella anatipestifer]|uniref:tRNA1(Val) (adenine(37)-N6)-methyltransferase n=1 Tax=Riemerella anatipestifer TaxID=34085 RepID=UPI001C6EB7E7|nr:methyltransferase [Riemerella anatipestifer]QYQ95890.1 methyltransferase [Riemerella anatipestifer]